MNKTIVAATDGSASGTRAVAQAAELSSKLGLDLHIVHVQLPGRPPNELRRLAEIEHLRDARKAMEALAEANVARFVQSREEEARNAQVVAAIGDAVLSGAQDLARRLGGRGVSILSCTGDPADEIVGAAKALNAAMIVVGRRGLGRLGEIMIGSVSQTVLHHAPCTVVVVSGVSANGTV